MANKFLDQDGLAEVFRLVHEWDKDTCGVCFDAMETPSSAFSPTTGSAGQNYTVVFITTEKKFYAKAGNKYYANWGTDRDGLGPLSATGGGVSPMTGRLYYNRGEKCFYIWDGAAMSKLQISADQLQGMPDIGVLTTAQITAAANSVINAI